MIPARALWLALVLAGPPGEVPAREGPPAPVEIEPPARTAGDLHTHTREADDFRRSDPLERALAQVAASSGLSRETAVQDHTDFLTLAEVLDRLAGRDPRLDAAQRSIDVADGELLAARGGFDTRLRARGLIAPIGEYQHGIVDVRVEQPTPLWGLSVFTGWRLGLGDFAVYDGKLATTSGGEVRAGASLPLWQDGPIDRRRTDLRSAKIGRTRAEHQRDAKQLELEAKAAAAYWTWVATGLEMEIERALLQLAMQRDAGLARKIELGDIEALVGADNRRLILSREARVVSAERAFQAAALSLSLFHRDATGEPIIAGADRLPLGFPPPKIPALTDIDAEVEAALQHRPDLAAKLDRRAQAELELRWACNQRSPRIDVSAWVAKDLGDGPAELQPVEVAALVELSVPIPLREGRGRYQAARAELAKIDAELRLARDEIALEVRDAHSELAAAYQRARLAADQVELARELAEAELRRFELGAGDLLLVNLRELAVADAQREYVEALAAFFVAEARLDVARGRGVGRGR